MEPTIVEHGDADYAELSQLQRKQGGTLVYRKSDDTLWRMYQDNNGPRFVLIDQYEQDPRDPTGRWGKYRYLGDTLLEADEDPKIGEFFD